ncbi:hypothetical protein [Bremerella sp.]|uniref:hypothetical protein n=1 Tax=Bremerella sp. TaxID=2795602 RepID=UPI00391C5C8D
MKPHHEPPDSGSENSPGRKPQVVVRAGKTFLCSSCGTLVEVPPEVVGQLVIAVEPTTQQEPNQEPPAQEQPPQTQSLQTQTPQKTHAQKQHSPQRPSPRPKRPRQPQRESFVGQTIDGLQVPSAQQLDRALKWVSFHLRVLDRQGSEINRLRKLLKAHPVPRPSPLERVREVPGQSSDELEPNVHSQHAHEDVSMAPLDATQKAALAKERGPP